MTAVKRHRRPANDIRMHSSPRRTRGTLSRPYWNGKRIAVARVLGFFALILGAALSVPRPVSTSLAPEAVEPFDIMLTSSALAPPENVVLPPDSAATESSLRKKGLPPVLDVTVEGDAEDQAEEEDQEDQAEYHAEAAQNFMRPNDITQALTFQHRAVELDPANMLYRLELAIMHDKAADQEGAAMLYRQVLQAYANHDESLPPKLGIDDIRRRFVYLTAKGS